MYIYIVVARLMCCGCGSRRSYLWMRRRQSWCDAQTVPNIALSTMRECINIQETYVLCDSRPAVITLLEEGVHLRLDWERDSMYAANGITVKYGRFIRVLVLPYIVNFVFFLQSNQPNAWRTHIKLRLPTRNPAQTMPTPIRPLSHHSPGTPRIKPLSQYKVAHKKYIYIPNVCNISRWTHNPFHLVKTRNSHSLRGPYRL